MRVPPGLPRGGRERGAALAVATRFGGAPATYTRIPIPPARGDKRGTSHALVPGRPQVGWGSNESKIRFTRQEYVGPRTMGSSQQQPAPGEPFTSGPSGHKGPG